jgi:flagellum-specific peptidoglycan hydrolase FlgJ
MTKQDYISTYWDSAKEACTGTPLFPLLAMAESACESAWGESELAKQGNNLFGVKAYPQYWHGETITMHTREYNKEGQPYYIDAPFKKYDTPADSFRDWINTVEGPRYQTAGVESATDAGAQIEAIAKAGYSSSPTYAATIESIMRGLKPLIPELNQAA